VCLGCPDRIWKLSRLGDGCSSVQMAMMFVRCRGGHSHSPLEHVAEADVAAAATAMLSFFRSQLLPLGNPSLERSEL